MKLLESITTKTLQGRIQRRREKESPSNDKEYGSMKSDDTPKRPFDALALDFIVGLPFSDPFDTGYLAACAGNYSADTKAVRSRSLIAVWTRW
ncbi:hypothetical protein EMCG_03378 [[Emmonsia] crescens]|uniref:Uncharacterized protein n=1 Tax=[Emmonsia] crescens TaxID=73230 RepID=A0A0G2J094_9EURO|nr:hypothetical protein EMCG_03378 [Emmonsia crescens UAMH 3008]